VRRGRVRVESARETLAVSAGEEHWFPTEVPEPETAGAPPAPATAPPSATITTTTDRHRAGGGARKHATPRWRVLAQRGDFHRAYMLLSQTGGTPRDDVEELLLAADVARRSSHFAEALPYYDRVIQSHAADPRAGLAALTQGRIALHRLGKPRDAAAAFAQARALTLPDALVEEAMLGEITAWRRAGEIDKARAVAAAYVQRYPRSPSAENLRRLGDLR
jgi:tetratricopeptide (TPR) repeat protein